LKLTDAAGGGGAITPLPAGSEAVTFAVTSVARASCRSTAGRARELQVHRLVAIEQRRGVDVAVPFDHPRPVVRPDGDAQHRAATHDLRLSGRVDAQQVALVVDEEHRAAGADREIRGARSLPLAFTLSRAAEKDRRRVAIPVAAVRRDHHALRARGEALGAGGDFPIQQDAVELLVGGDRERVAHARERDIVQPERQPHQAPRVAVVAHERAARADAIGQARGVHAEAPQVAREGVEALLRAGPAPDQPLGREAIHAAVGADGEFGEARSPQHERERERSGVDDLCRVGGAAHRATALGVGLARGERDVLRADALRVQRPVRIDAPQLAAADADHRRALRARDLGPARLLLDPFEHAALGRRDDDVARGIGRDLARAPRDADPAVAEAPRDAAVGAHRPQEPAPVHGDARRAAGDRRPRALRRIEAREVAGVGGDHDRAVWRGGERGRALPHFAPLAAVEPLQHRATVDRPDVARWIHRDARHVAPHRLPRARARLAARHHAFGIDDRDHAARADGERARAAGHGRPRARGHC